MARNHFCSWFFIDWLSPVKRDFNLKLSWKQMLFAWNVTIFILNIISLLTSQVKLQKTVSAKLNLDTESKCQFSEKETSDYFRKTYQGLHDKTYTVFCKFLPCQLTFSWRKFNVVTLLYVFVCLFISYLFFLEL